LRLLFRFQDSTNTLLFETCGMLYENSNLATIQIKHVCVHLLVSDGYNYFPLSFNQRIPNPFDGNTLTRLAEGDSKCTIIKHLTC